jgi:hypothetical protein
MWNHANEDGIVDGRGRRWGVGYAWMEQRKNKYIEAKANIYVVLKVPVCGFRRTVITF